MKVNDDQGVASAITLKRLNQLTGLLTILLILAVGLIAFKAVTKQFETPKTYYEDQVQYWSQVLSKTPQDQLARTRLAQIRLKMGQPGKAIAELKTVLKNDPEYMPAYYYLGMAYQNQGKNGEAEKNFLKAIKLTKNVKVNVQPAYRLAILYEEEGKVDKAIKYYEMASEGEPLLWNPHFKLGELYEKKGRLEEALARYEQAAKYNPDSKVTAAVKQVKGKLNVD